MAKPRVPLAKLSSADRAKRVAQLVKSPGTRAAVPTQYLPPAMRKQREMNARLSQPVIPGSTMTGRDLAHAGNEAVQVKYGQADRALQGIARDTPGWYDEYQRDVVQHTTNVQGYGDRANAAARDLQGGIGGLSQASLDDRQRAANADAATRNTAASDLSPTASNAAAVRQAIAASLGGQTVESGRAANTYADTLAHVVAPTQKLSATTQAAGKLASLREEEGAYNQQVRGEKLADEMKNVLSAKALGLDVSKAKQNAATDAANIDLKRGVDPVTGKALPSKPKTPSVITGGAFAGYTKEQVAGMSSARKQKLKDSYAATGGKGKPVDAATKYAKDFYARYGVKPASTGAVGGAKDAIGTASSYVSELKQSGLDRRTIGRLLLQGASVDTTEKDKSGKAVKKSYPKIKPLWLTVALDQAFTPGGLISAGTAKRLHGAGYSVKVLGLSTGAPTITGPKDLPSGGPTNPK